MLPACCLRRRLGLSDAATTPRVLRGSHCGSESPSPVALFLLRCFFLGLFLGCHDELLWFVVKGLAGKSGAKTPRQYCALPRFCREHNRARRKAWPVWLSARGLASRMGRAKEKDSHGLSFCGFWTEAQTGGNRRIRQDEGSGRHGTRQPNSAAGG